MPLLKRFPSATQEEIDELKKLVKKVDRAERLEQAVQPQPSNAPPDVKEIASNLGRPESRTVFPPSSRIFKEIGNASVTREAINLDNPIQLLLLLMPEKKPYKWQFEELMRMAGYLQVKGTTLGPKTRISDFEPYKPILACANGSGKDMILIAGFAVWFAMKRARNCVIITSSSFDQTKFQTEVHIRELCNRANKQFGPLFKYTQFHYVIPELGSEIKLFATDEAGRAEGFHPYSDGEMAIIINEAKSVKEDIFNALARCTGYSHWIEISSPGPRSGHMFRMVGNAVHYPNTPRPGEYFFRRVTAFDCPHISPAHIEAMKHDKGENSPWYRSSILAEFSDFDEPVVITESAFDKCYINPPKESGDDIGIGLDLAGGGDEDACFVRRGNKIIHSFFFRQQDTDLAALLIDKHLESWKNGSYSFRADNGGIGQAIIDKIVQLGWRVKRTNNQSPAYNKREFLNLGAEMYFYVKRLIERNEIILPNTERLRLQLTTRRYNGFDTTQGRLSLESKAEARAAGRTSPDRADAFVLCFASFRGIRRAVESSRPVPDGRNLVTMSQLLDMSHKGLLRPKTPSSNGVFTMLDGKI